MTTYLDEILDPALLGQMMDEGYVQVRYHPDYPLAIYCYTKQAMFDRKWNDVTKVCRGLIVNEDTSEVIARPFRKFFNYGEPSAPFFAPTDLVEVTDKMDGSLGILYSTPDGLAVATKGSFTSDQAKWATEHLRAQYGDTEWTPPDGVTFLFEIIYPENRIVLDYGDQESLKFLASIDIKSGRDVILDPYDDPFTTTEFLGKDSFKNFMMNPEWYTPRINKEGLVIRRVTDDERLKFKQDDYIELHRVMTGLNERQIWQWLAEGKYSKDILPTLPEEMHDWVGKVIADLTTSYLGFKGMVEQAFRESKYMDRKEFALFNAGKSNWVKGALFAKYDGNHDRADQIVWNRVKP